MKINQIRNELHILKEKIRQNPKNHKTYYNLGIFYSKHGNYNGAIQTYQRAIKLNPKSADILNSLGLVLWNLKRYERSSKELQKSSQNKPQASLCSCKYGKCV
ncbi:MAG TPA: tetratricopeptide repeat protein [Nitrospinaceae bacterium]|nr:tetratricopeptide repeat protein [Nitrospinaceae bacterium]